MYYSPDRVNIRGYNFRSGAYFNNKDRDHAKNKKGTSGERSISNDEKVRHPPGYNVHQTICTYKRALSRWLDSLYTFKR